MKIEMKKNNAFGTVTLQFEDMKSVIALMDIVNASTAITSNIENAKVADAFADCIRDEVCEIISDLLYALPLGELIEMWNRYLDQCAMSDHFINKMDLLDFVLTEETTLPKSEILRMACEGNFKYDDDYFYFGFDNLSSFSSLCDSPISIDELTAVIWQECDCLGSEKVEQLLKTLSLRS